MNRPFSVSGPPLRLLLPLLAAFAPFALPAAPPPPPPTVIKCAGLAEIISNDKQTVATFHDHVVVTGNDLKLFCDLLKVVATRIGDPKATIGEYGSFKSLLATGHVRIIQGDREATCAKAEVLPGEERIILSGDPVVRSLDGQYVATGPRLVLYRGQRRAVIEGSTSQPARIALPPIKDLGFAPKKKPAATAPTHPAPGPKP